MRFLGLVLAVVMSLPAWAGFRAYNGNTDLSIFDSIKCSTGVTCSRVGGKLNIVSSPTITAGEFTVQGAEATDGILNIIADEADDSGDSWAVKALASGNSLVFQNNVSGSLVTKMSLSTAGALSGYLAPQVAATATTITAAQCGSTFSNTGAVLMNLPEASTVIGCTLTFATLNASNFDVNPDDADQILVQTNAVGDAIRNATLGNTITIRAVSASQWVTIGATGTWTDIN